MISFSRDLKSFAAERKDEIALIESRNNKSWSWAELDELVDKVGGWLRAKNIPVGKSVVAVLPNSAEALVLFLACIRYGNLLAPVTPQSTPRELKNWLDMVDPVAVVASASAAPEIGPTMKLHLVQIDSKFEWCSKYDGGPSEVDGGSLCIPTSGTTGTPKPLVHDGSRLWESGKRFIEYHTKAAGGRYLNNLPMSYLGGMFNLGLIPLAGGGSTVITSEFTGQSFFNYWREIDQFQIDVLWLVPTIIRGLLAIGDRMSEKDRIKIGKKVRFAFLGTAPIDLDSKIRFEKTFNIQLVENFGLSETTFITSERLYEDKKRSEGSVGSILPYTDIKLRPFIDEEEASRKVLEVYARTPFMAKGYLQPDGTIFDPRGKDGYLATGDLGYWDKEENLVLTGRSRDVIKKGGLLVSLREIEVVAEGHRSIEEAAAVPITHKFYGENAALFVQLREGGEEFVLQEFQKYLAFNLSRHKLPESVTVVNELPKTASGKIQKSVLAIKNL